MQFCGKNARFPADDGITQAVFLLFKEKKIPVASGVEQRRKLLGWCEIYIPKTFVRNNIFLNFAVLCQRHVLTTTLARRQPAAQITKRKDKYDQLITRIKAARP